MPEQSNMDTIKAVTNRRDIGIRASLTLRLNNQAVRALAEGRCEDAILNLAKALRTSKHILFHFDGMHHFLGGVTLTSCMNQQGASVSPPADLAVEPKCEETTQESQRLVDESSTTFTKQTQLSRQDQNKGSFLYEQGILIPSDLSICYESSVLLSVAIIFNLALAYQLAAAKNGTKQRRYLRNATKLYELAHNLQCDENLDSILFVLACVNNLGQLHRSVGDEVTADKCFGHLLATLMLAVVNCDESERSTTCMPGFFENATEKLRSKTATAA